MMSFDLKTKSSHFPSRRDTIVKIELTLLLQSWIKFALLLHHLLTFKINDVNERLHTAEIVRGEDEQNQNESTYQFLNLLMNNNFKA